MVDNFSSDENVSSVDKSLALTQITGTNTFSTAADDILNVGDDKSSIYDNDLGVRSTSVLTTNLQCERTSFLVYEPYV